MWTETEPLTIQPREIQMHKVHKKTRGRAQSTGKMRKKENRRKNRTRLWWTLLFLMLLSLTLNSDVTDDDRCLSWVFRCCLDMQYWHRIFHATRSLDDVATALAVFVHLLHNVFIPQHFMASGWEKSIDSSVRMRHFESVVPFVSIHEWAGVRELWIVGAMLTRKYPYIYSTSIYNYILL